MLTHFSRLARAPKLIGDETELYEAIGGREVW